MNFFIKDFFSKCDQIRRKLKKLKNKLVLKMRKYLILHKPLSTSLYLEKVTVSSAIKGVHMKLDVIIPEKGA